MNLSVYFIFFVLLDLGPIQNNYMQSKRANQQISERRKLVRNSLNHPALVKVQNIRTAPKCMRYMFEVGRNIL